MRFVHRIQCAVVLGMAVCVAGCQQPASAVRQKSTAFTRALLDENLSAAVEFVHPDVVKKKGTERLEFELNLARMIGGGLSKLLTGGQDITDFEIREVTLNEKVDRATVDMVYLAAPDADGNREEFPRQQVWVKHEGQWYLEAF